MNKKFLCLRSYTNTILLSLAVFLILGTSSICSAGDMIFIPPTFDRWVNLDQIQDRYATSQHPVLEDNNTVWLIRTKVEQPQELIDVTDILLSPKPELNQDNCAVVAPSNDRLYRHFTILQDQYHITYSNKLAALVVDKNGTANFDQMIDDSLQGANGIFTILILDSEGLMDLYRDLANNYRDAYKESVTQLAKRAAQKGINLVVVYDNTIASTVHSIDGSHIAIMQNNDWLSPCGLDYFVYRTADNRFEVSSEISCN